MIFSFLVVHIFWVLPVGKSGFEFAFVRGIFVCVVVKLLSLGSRVGHRLAHILVLIMHSILLVLISTSERALKRLFRNLRAGVVGRLSDALGKSHFRVEIIRI